MANNVIAQYDGGFLPYIFTLDPCSSAAILLHIITTFFNYVDSLSRSRPGVSVGNLETL